MEPSIRNFKGQAHTNQDLTSLSWIASCPFAGGYHTGSMRVNGQTIKINSFRWFPYEVIRKGSMKNIHIISITKMVVDENIFLWEVNIQCDDDELVNVEIDHIGIMSNYENEKQWEWWYPYPTLDGKTIKREDESELMREYIGTGITHGICHDMITGKPRNCSWPSDEELMSCKKYYSKLIIDEKKYVFFDTETDAISMFKIISPKPSNLSINSSGGTSTWKFSFSKEESNQIKIQFMMGFGNNENELNMLIDKVSKNFEEYWKGVKTEWEFRWLEMFKPNNTMFSGSFPVLDTTDKKARKVYYTGPLTLLLLLNTHLPQHSKVFLTGGPRWGATISFFWEMTQWQTLWAVLDPQMMKEHLTSAIQIDIEKYYGVDNFGGKGVGYLYSADYWSMFQMIRSYITVTGNYEYLKEVIDGKTILEYLESYSIQWKNLSIHGKNDTHWEDIYKLADFGDDPWALLECVPTYKHIVPSFNVGYIWMMREVAEFYKYLGEKDKAKYMISMANKMVKRVLKLYSRDGFFYCLFPNGSKVEVRHCLDFVYFGTFLSKDIPENIINEMIDFIYRELITDNWMRALSKYDKAAKYSDRTDHGPLGAYDGWPAGIMESLVELGYQNKALDFYHKIERVTYEGTWSQSHELWGDRKWQKDAKVRIAKRNWSNRDSSAGIALSQVMIKNFFGFNPSVDGKPIKDYKKWVVNGKLYHVKYKGEYYTLISSSSGIKMIKEEKVY